MKQMVLNIPDSLNLDEKEIAMTLASNIIRGRQAVPWAGSRVGWDIKKSLC